MLNSLLRAFGLTLVLTASLLAPQSTVAMPIGSVSPDGRYGAEVVGTGADVHFALTELATGRSWLTTPPFASVNDVKNGRFSPPSDLFAALYHYGHRGPETAVRIYDLSTGALTRGGFTGGLLYDMRFRSLTVTGNDILYPSDAASIAGPYIELFPGESAIMVAAIQGHVSVSPSAPVSGPDGTAGHTSIPSQHGIAGIEHLDRRGFLAGYFADDRGATVAPASLVFASGIDAALSDAYASLAPLLYQPFFIGDGLSGMSADDLQSITVPAAATRLYLGFPELVAGGSLDMAFLQVGNAAAPHTPVSAPGTAVLMLAALATLPGARSLWNRRRSISRKPPLLLYDERT